MARGPPGHARLAIARLPGNLSCSFMGLGPYHQGDLEDTLALLHAAGLNVEVDVDLGLRVQLRENQGCAGNLER